MGNVTVALYFFLFLRRTVSFQPDFHQMRRDQGLHPFHIEHPAVYTRLEQEDIEPDMHPFDCWEFYFDNGWGVSILDAHNTPGPYRYDEGRLWILDFGAWETDKGIKRFFYCRHPQMEEYDPVALLTLNQVSEQLHRICRFADRTYGASKTSKCLICKRHINRSDIISWDERLRPYHLSCC
jgi:hypothetical protein